MKKRKFILPAKTISATIVIFIALWLVAGYTWKFLKTADYFKIKEVMIKEAKIRGLEYLKGENIFTLDLKKESRYILESYPDYSKVKFVRVFPDKIFVYFIKRRPLALIKLYKYFAVDEEGVFFYAPANLQELELPVITGLETKIFGPKLGRRYNSRELLFALNIIKEAKNNKILKDYKIKRIDVASIANISLFILLPQKAPLYAKGQERAIGPETMEVKISQDYLKDKIAILSTLITEGKFDLANIKYIDLRFKDPVVKLNNAKQ